MEKCPIDLEKAHYDELFYFALYGKPGMLKDDDPVLLTFLNQTLPPEKQVPVPEIETDDPIVLDLLSKKKLPKSPAVVEKVPENLKEDTKDEDLPVYRRSYIVNFDWSDVKGEYRALDYDKYLEVDEERPTARMCRLLTMVIFKLFVYLEKYLEDMLKKTMSDMSIIHDKILEFKSSGNIAAPRRLSWLNMYGMPYFKDSQYFPCPPNEDAQRKKWNNELLVNELHTLCDWNAVDCHKLRQAIKAEEVARRSQKVKRDTLKLSKCLDAANSKEKKAELQQKISALPSLDRIKGMSPKELCEDIQWEYDWLKIAAQDFHGFKHPDECRAVWQIYLHPKINRGAWSNEENERLKQLVKDYNFQNWEAIAENLGTNRTPLLVMQHYQRNLNEGFINKTWTEEEDRLLVKLVATCRFGSRISWKKIAQRLKGHTKQQIFKHWTYHLNPNLCKGPFTKSEDMLLVAAVRSCGDDYYKLLELFPYRTREQLRNRHRALTKLYPNTWDDNENEKLLTLVERYGEGKWKKICEYFSDRTAASLKEQYATLKDRMERFTESNCNVSESEDKEEDTVCEEHKLWRKVQQICPVLKECDKLDSNGLKKLKEMLIKETRVPPQNIRTLTRFEREYYTYFKCVSDPDAAYENDLYDNKQRLEKPEVLKYILHLLHAKLHIPNEGFMSHHAILKKRDRDLLRQLPGESFMVSEVRQEFAKDEVGLKYCLPPNFTTLGGFCSIMLHRRYVLDEQEQDKKKEMQVQAGEAGRLFEERFRFLFLWPALATVEPPAIGQLPPIEDSVVHSSQYTIPRKRKRRPTRVELLNIFGPKKKQRYTRTKRKQKHATSMKELPTVPSDAATPSTSYSIDRNDKCTVVEIKDDSIYQTLLASQKNKKQETNMQFPSSSVCGSLPEKSKQQQVNLSSTSVNFPCTTAPEKSKQQQVNLSSTSVNFPCTTAPEKSKQQQVNLSSTSVTAASEKSKQQHVNLSSTSVRAASEKSKQQQVNLSSTSVNFPCTTAPEKSKQQQVNLSSTSVNFPCTTAPEKSKQQQVNLSSTSVNFPCTTAPEKSKQQQVNLSSTSVRAASEKSKQQQVNLSSTSVRAAPEKSKQQQVNLSSTSVRAASEKSKQQQVNLSSTSVRAASEKSKQQQVNLSSTSVIFPCTTASEKSKQQQTHTSYTSINSFCSSAPFSSTSLEPDSADTFSFNSAKCIRTYSRVKKPKTQPANVSGSLTLAKSEGT